MINLIISGHVGQDARELDNGCVFNIASTKRGYTKKDGSKVEDKTIWISVFAVKGLAPHIKKGDFLSIYTDFINTDVYEGKAQLSCYAISVEFGSKAQRSNQTEPTQNKQTQPSDAEPFKKEDEAHDLPF